MLHKYRVLFLLLYVLVGIYFLNYPLAFVEIPDAIAKFDPWIIFAGGILVLFGGINYFKTSRYKAY